MKKIKKVIHWSNNMVMVYDKNGEQMPKYQGSYLKVREKILKNCDENTIFSRADWGTGEKIISKELF